MSAAPLYLARFRADPSRVRVGVRRVGALTMVTISSTTPDGPSVIAVHSGPRKALVLALREAEYHGIGGIDLAMGSAYPHPQLPSSIVEPTESGS